MTKKEGKVGELMLAGATREVGELMCSSSSSHRQGASSSSAAASQPASTSQEEECMHKEHYMDSAL
jgi:hypothetical protein